MGTLELQQLLIHRISEINDTAFLNAIKVLLDSKVDNSVLTLTPEQQEEIAISRNEIKQGLYITQTDLDLEMDAWLKNG
ncbi:hypothetical protein SAMN05216436_101146 [bacterium A37T11]|nr:hypothetical protein SAMN05216436_101146 [bacterium A37T11]